MKSRLFPILFFCLLPFCLFSQADERLRVELTTGVSDYYTFSDFSRSVYSRNGRDYSQGSGNITEGTKLFFLRLGLAYPVANRWSVAPFVEVHTGQGTLFEEEFLLTGIGQPEYPEGKRYNWPSPNELTVFAAGVDARYLILNGSKTRIHAGLGLAFVSRTHTYQEFVQIDFDENHDENFRITEEQTVNRKAVGIPLSLGLEQGISDRLSLGLNLRLHVHSGIEDHFWAGGLNFSYSL